MSEGKLRLWMNSLIATNVVARLLSIASVESSVCYARAAEARNQARYKMATSSASLGTVTSQRTW